ncbi:hypothetical protein CDD80_7168 [Ophiocordyceps camponoti-rufipedis]|uniref:Mitochondrial thiamine pyrophosphate carrier 1 n=1 Tax=Ophiocordyceps camponoti-rufipedis TaxID=2004952 RepID=A0A2C5XSK2_9HYPO|nr:hypothetical protein CDD80_7168 [Ophiocordyceps camponoti-rufipedis]
MRRPKEREPDESQLQRDVRLGALWEQLDPDHAGELDLKGLRRGLRKIDHPLKNADHLLKQIMKEVDTNHDGKMQFQGTLRNFLLFMPARQDDSQLGAVLSYYFAVVNVTPEGDSIVKEDTLEGTEAHGPNMDVPDGAADLRVDIAATAGPPDTGKGMKAEANGDGTTDQSSGKAKKLRLTELAPDPGYFLAGAIAGGLSRTATAPLDRLKVYLLVSTKSESQTATAALKQGRLVAALRNALRPLGDAVKDVYRSGGLSGFFAGNGLNVVKIMPETAIKFGTYEAAKRAFAEWEGHGDPTRISSISKFTAGGVAGMMAQFCIYPLDTLKFRLQCETVKGGLTGTALVRQTAIKMYADGGLRSCYRGVTMGLVGMFPYSAIDMTMFELLKSSYRSRYARRTGCHEDDANPGNMATGIIGATSGAIGATVVYPLNVVRTRLQTQGTAGHRETYTGIWDVARKTYRREGLRGFYKGLTPNLLKVAPALSITWVVYENSKRLLGLR